MDRGLILRLPAIAFMVGLSGVAVVVVRNVADDRTGEGPEPAVPQDSTCLESASPAAQAASRTIFIVADDAQAQQVLASPSLISDVAVSVHVAPAGSEPSVWSLLDCAEPRCSSGALELVDLRGQTGGPTVPASP